MIFIVYWPPIIYFLHSSPTPVRCLVLVLHVAVAMEVGCVLCVYVLVLYKTITPNCKESTFFFRIPQLQNKSDRFSVLLRNAIVIITPLL
jgi:hypothetical protein